MSFFTLGIIAYQARIVIPTELSVQWSFSDYCDYQDGWYFARDGYC